MGERSEGSSRVREGDTEGPEAAEESEEEEDDPCILGTCSCKVTFVATGKRVPRDKFAMSIRHKYE